MDLMEKIASLAKRRGFIYQGSEIYGGFGGFWDYGPLGVELKNNIKRQWWQSMVYDREDVVGLDAAIIMNPKVWEVSGHLKSLTDPLVECKVCHKRFRLDAFEKFRKAAASGANAANVASRKEYLDAFICKDGRKHPREMLTEEKKFNLMTEVLVGTTEPKEIAYLRGEITQGVFVNFLNVINSTRVRIPFGIAQIGKAFRNEITPGNLTFRSREFEQMELEYFIKPDAKDAEKSFEFWKKERLNWYVALGIDKEKLRFRKHEDTERAHYAKEAVDIEYQAPFGWSEFEGIHNRGDYDLGNHKIAYHDELMGKDYIPWVIETSGGVDRAALFFLIDAYHEDGERVVLKLHPRLSPFKAAVFPLLANKGELVKKAREVYLELKPKLNSVSWDDRGNIGKRYFAQDEIGTPYCVTVDFTTLDDNSVTVRDRDTAKQERVSVDKLDSYLQNKIG